MKLSRELSKFDPVLIITTGLLLVIGLAIQYSLCISTGSFSFFYKQLAASLIGVVVFFVISRWQYKDITRNNRIYYVAVVLLLVSVLVFTGHIRGSRRWIDLGFFNLQPVEFMKLTLIFALSRFFAFRRGQINSVKNIFVTLVILGIPSVLVLVQPDLGSTIILAAIWFGMLLSSHVKKQFIVLVLGLAVVSGVVIWNVGLKDYQRHRIETFLNPELDKSGKGYNVNQALIAVGSGQVFGQGLGKGAQGTLRFLPERQTDFVFAATAEQIGFVGCSVLLILYGVLFIRILYISRLAPDSLGGYLCAGVFCMLFTHTIINIGMNVGLLPVTGITLPFVSYGGSSILADMLALGIVQGVYMQGKSVSSYEQLV